MTWAFGYFFRQPVVGRAYEEATTRPASEASRARRFALNRVTASAIGKDERRERCSAEIAIADDDRSTSAARNSHIRNVY